MKLNRLFPRVIAETTNTTFDLLKDINNLKHRPSGSQKWVSNKTYSTFGRDLGQVPEFLPFLQWQDSQVQMYANELHYTFKKFKCQAWYNIYKKNDYQELHNHKGFDISTIFMVKGHKDSAYTYFTDFDLEGSPRTIYNEDNSAQWKFSFEPGKLLIFPSFMLHGVSQHDLHDERITVASNYKLT